MINKELLKAYNTFSACKGDIKEAAKMVEILVSDFHEKMAILDHLESVEKEAAKLDAYKSGELVKLFIISDFNDNNSERTVWAAIQKDVGFIEYESGSYFTGARTIEGVENMVEFYQSHSKVFDSFKLLSPAINALFSDMLQKHIDNNKAK